MNFKLEEYLKNRKRGHGKVNYPVNQPSGYVILISVLALISTISITMLTAVIMGIYLKGVA
jgi:hypothetical protein